MRRRCIYCLYNKKNKTMGLECHGWLIQITVSGNATFYFIETLDGSIIREHSTYCTLRLVDDDTPIPGEKTKKESKGK